MDSHVQRRGPFSGEIGAAVRSSSGSACFPYAIRSTATNEIVFDGYASDLQEAVQTVDVCLDYLLEQMPA